MASPPGLRSRSDNSADYFQVSRALEIILVLCRYAHGNAVRMVQGARYDIKKRRPLECFLVTELAEGTMYRKCLFALLLAYYVLNE